MKELVGPQNCLGNDAVHDYRDGAMKKRASDGSRSRLIKLGLCAVLVLSSTYPAFAMAAGDEAACAPDVKMQNMPGLAGTVSVDALQTPATPSTDHVFDKLDGDELDKRLTVAPHKGKSIVHFAASSTVSLANFLLDLRGFDWSKEGADVTLDEHVKAKGDSAKEYLHRRRADQLQLQALSSVMQLAEGIGSKESPETKAEIENATSSLRECVGTEEADNIVRTLTDKAREPGSLRTAKWNLQVRNEKMKQILESTAQSDPVIADLKRRLSKYNHRSKFMQISAKVVYSATGIASFSPTLIAPIAETAFLAFMMASGGPEQDKLLKELYLAKCLESRVQLVNEEAHLLVDSYQAGVTTSNPLLEACSESLLARMSSPEVCDNVFAGHSTTTISSGAKVNPSAE